MCSCLEEIGKWSRANLLQLNDEKTDVVVFGTKHKLPLMKDIRIIIGEATFNISSNVRNLDVILYSSLCMTNHISAICQTAFMHLHNISRIRRYLTIDATNLLVHAFVMSRLYYGNALFAGLPLEHLLAYHWNTCWPTTGTLAGLPLEHLLAYHWNTCWPTTGTLAGLPLEHLLAYHWNTCWPTTGTLAGLPLEHLLAYHWNTCWPTTGTLAGVPLEHLLAYHWNTCWPTTGTLAGLPLEHLLAYH